MITLDATLQAAMDGDVHHPIIRLLSKKSVDDIPFIGNVFTTSEYEQQFSSHTAPTRIDPRSPGRV